MSTIARGTFEVQLQPLSFENADANWQFGRLSIDKQISGDLVAVTRGQMMSARTSTTGSAGYVALEHVTGTLHGLSGSFVLLHRGIMDRGAPAQWIDVVPDSGTEQLAGLSGAFRIIITGGVHQYEFGYRLGSEA